VSDLDVVSAAADALARAEADRVPIPPLTTSYEGLDVERAYRIQLHNITRRLDAGDVVRGHKVGLSSPAMQQMLGVDEPDYGHLLASMFHPDGGTVPLDRFIQPRVEIEVAFVLGKPLVGPGITLEDVYAATDYVVPALEIVDSRIEDWRIAIEDTVADNASSAGLVLGVTPTRLGDLPIDRIPATLRANGEVRERGTSGAVLGNPAIAVAWLANKVAAFGIHLEGGDVVLPGSCTRMIPVADGDVISATFDGLGPVSATFVEHP